MMIYPADLRTVNTNTEYRAASRAPGNTKLINKCFLLEDRVFPVTLHFCHVPVRGEVPERICEHHYSTNELTDLPKSQSARPDVR